MENKMMMPANYNVMNEEEMTYTQGGAADSTAVAVGYAVAIGMAAVSVCNAYWAITSARKWVKANKTGDIGDTITKGVDAFFTYATSSVWNTVVSVYTVINMIDPIYLAIGGIACVVA